MTTLDLETLVLHKGAHDSGSAEMCVMEAVAFIAGEQWSDSPACASPTIATFLRRWNDDLSDDDRQILKPLIPLLVGTNTGQLDEEKRGWLLTDWMVREYLPAWLRTANLHSQADAVVSLLPILSIAAWEAGKGTVLLAKKDAAAARAAAWDAARAAAWDAARADARAAAWDAARDAAWAAAWDAARAAARAAAWAAAWDVARDVARDAARAAAWDVARDAVWAATRDAATKYFRPTVHGIQASAIQLVRRMIAVGKT